MSGSKRECLPFVLSHTAFLVPQNGRSSFPHHRTHTQCKQATEARSSASAPLSVEAFPNSATSAQTCTLALTHTQTYTCFTFLSTLTYSFHILLQTHKAQCLSCVYSHSWNSLHTHLPYWVVVKVCALCLCAGHRLPGT